MSLICPYCEQDYIWLTTIHGLKEDVKYCGECDTIWTIKEQVTDKTGVPASVFIKAQGKDYTDCKITLKEKIE